MQMELNRYVRMVASETKKSLPTPIGKRRDGMYACMLNLFIVAVFSGLRARLGSGPQNAP